VTSGRPVDLDTLADYVEGVLDTEDAAEVASLIADDPEWSATYAQLTGALPQVASALAAVPAEPMPAPVSSRIASALEALDRPTNVVSIERARSVRFGKRSTWLKVAAAVIFIGLFLGVLPQFVGSSNSGGSEKSSSASGGAITNHEAVRGPVQLSASGRDYTAAMLANSAPAAPQAGGTASTSNVPGPTRRPSVGGNNQTFGAEEVPPSLRQFTDQSRLNECLDDVAKAVGGGTPSSVDFAQYAHQPALIIGFSDLPSSVAVGSACGQNGADILARG
jgi:anti-sigma factor RsiW